MVVSLFSDVLLPRAAQNLSKGNKWWWPARLLPAPEEFNILRLGSPTGPYGGLIESINEKNYDPVQDLYTPDPDARKFIPEDRRDWWAEHGMAWVGYNRYYHELTMEYDVWEPLPLETTGVNPDTDTQLWGIVRKRRGLFERETGKPPAFYWRYSIAVVAQRIEIKTDAPIDMVFNLSVEIESPRRAFFYEGGWIKKLHPAAVEVAKEYVRNMTFEEVRQLQSEGAESINSKIMALSGESREEVGSLRNLAGVVIRDVRFEHVDVHGAALRKAMDLIEVAQREARADKIRGEGTRDRQINEAQGDEAKIRALAAAGPEAAFAKALIETKADTIVLGGGVMPAINVSNSEKKGKDKEEDEEK